MYDRSWLIWQNPWFGVVTDFLVTCLLLWFIVLLIVVLEGSEKTMCDSRFWLLRELGVEAQQQLQ